MVFGCNGFLFCFLVVVAAVVIDLELTRTRCLSKHSKRMAYMVLALEPGPHPCILRCRRIGPGNGPCRLISHLFKTWDNFFQSMPSMLARTSAPALMVPAASLSPTPGRRSKWWFSADKARRRCFLDRKVKSSIFCSRKRCRPHPRQFSGWPC